MSYLDTNPHRAFLAATAKPVGIVCAILGAIALLHYSQPLYQRYRGWELLKNKLQQAYPGHKTKVLRSSDLSNYVGLFDLSGLVLTGGNEEYWDFCLSVEVVPKSSGPKVVVFRAGGDRAYSEMKLRQVANFKKCLSDQAG